MGSEMCIRDSDQAFGVAENFDATSVKLTRSVRGGVNSFVLPFYVNADEVGATGLATYSKMEGNNVVFAKATSAEANVPFITVDAQEATELNFTNKAFVATPETFEGVFLGVYAPQSANGLYGVDNNGKIHKGGESATINAFHAYLQLPETVEAPALTFEDAATGIGLTTVDTDDAPVYNLSGCRVANSLKDGKLARGLYISGGKKVVVK